MWNTNVSFSFWLYTFAPVAFYVCGQRPILLVVDVVVHIHGADLFSLSLSISLALNLPFFCNALAMYSIYSSSVLHCIVMLNTAQRKH